MIRIFTDSASNLSSKTLSQYGITMLYFHLFINGTEQNLRDSFDGKAYYEQLRQGAQTKTSLVNTFDFTEGFEGALKNGDDVLYIGISSGISGTHQAAVLAMEDLMEKYPERKIAVVDTRAASLAEGLTAVEAAKLVKNGASFEEVVNKANKLADVTNQFFTVDDLGHLQKGGRVSKAAALVGTLLNIKPMLKGDPEGRIIVYEKVRGRKKSIDTLAEKYITLCKDKSQPVGIAHGDCESDALALADKLRAGGMTGELMLEVYEPTTGAHVGPGALAMFFYGETR